MQRRKYNASLSGLLYWRKLTLLILYYIFSIQNSFRFKYSSYTSTQFSSLFCAHHFVLLPDWEALRSDKCKLPLSDLLLADGRKKHLQMWGWVTSGRCTFNVVCIISPTSHFNLTLYTWCYCTQCFFFSQIVRFMLHLPLCKHQPPSYSKLYFCMNWKPAHRTLPLWTHLI